MILKSLFQIPGMKNSHRLLLLAIVSGLVLSCDKGVFSSTQNEDSFKVSFRAISGDNPMSKSTLMSDGSIYWTPGDQINFFYGTNGSSVLTSDNTEIAAVTNFYGTLTESLSFGGDYYWAVYPYNENNTFDGEAITITLPETQTGQEGTFAKDYFLSMAKTQDHTLQFYNICGGIKFSLVEEGIKYVTFSGNNDEILAGRFTASFDANGRPQIQEVLDGKKVLRLDAPNGESFEVGKWYYIVSLPASLSQGYTMSLYKDELFGEGVVNSSTVIPRSTWGRLTEVFTANQYLTFTSEGTTKISLTNEGENTPILYYSTDKTNWTLWDYSELTFTQGAPLYICGDNSAGFSSSYDKYSQFVTSDDQFAVSGSVMSLLDKDEEMMSIPCANCFYHLFYECEGLISAPELPATELHKSCYEMMFSLCINLTTAPSLPATVMAWSCYSNMFNGCFRLTTPPELPATQLALTCYYGMFSYCNSLTTAPELPATTLAKSCYLQMFYHCDNLINAPELPSTTLAESCYADMFNYCKKLSTAPLLPATTLTKSCYKGMFRGCEGMQSAPSLPATVLAENCYADMFFQCSKLIDAPVLPATTLAVTCYSGMFRDCKQLSNAPDLPAATLVDGCYAGMFRGCTNLNYIKCLATDISAEGCLTDWLDGVASTGTFVKERTMNDWTTGASGIPTGWVVMRNGDVANGGNESTSEEAWN